MANSMFASAGAYSPSIDSVGTGSEKDPMVSLMAVRISGQTMFSIALRTSSGLISGLYFDD